MRKYKALRFERDVSRYTNNGGHVITIPGLSQAYLETKVDGYTIESLPISQERVDELVEEWGGLPYHEEHDTPKTFTVDQVEDIAIEAVNRIMSDLV